MKDDKEFKNKIKTKVALEWVKDNQKALLNYYNSFAIKELIFNYFFKNCYFLGDIFS